MQNLHDRQTCIETDEVGKRQRPHRMICAQAHRRINAFNRAYTLVESVDGLIDHGHKDPVDDKGRVVLGIRGRLL